MNLFKNKLTLASPFIVIAILLIFSLALIPTISPSPKNLPVAIINEDQGVVLPDGSQMNMGEIVTENVQKMAESGDESPIKWTTLSSYKVAKKALDDQAYYGALIIPKDFSKKQASLQTPKPVSPEIQILINQGMNPMASNMTGQILNSVVDKMNEQVRTQSIAALKQQGDTITIEQASAIATPITKKVVNVNEIGMKSANGNAPVSLFQPLWMASLIGSVVLFLAFPKTPLTNRNKRLSAILSQIIAGAVLALIAGFGLTWLASSLLGLDIPAFISTALFLSLTYFSFFLMITAILMWLGYPAIPIFALMLFFGAPLISMAPEFMSAFYHDWIYAWLPMRFMVEGLRGLFFFDKAFIWNHATAALTYIGLGGLIVLILSVFKPSKQK